LKQLFGRLNEPRRWVYWVAALPALLAAEFAFEANAHWPYLGVAVVLASSFFWPCRFGWYLATTIYIAATGTYLWQTVVDLWRLGAGGQPKILVDADDSFGFAIWIIFLVVVLALLIWCRPWRKPATYR
jgi:hypothetical protein